MATTDVLQLANIDPELAELLKANPAPPPVWEVAAVREGSKQRIGPLVAALAKPVPGLHEENITIPAKDGHQIPIRIHRPTTPPRSGSPLIVMYHGGGFVVGSPDGEALSCRAFVEHFGAVCVNVDYRLAPEHPFPTGVEDSWTALQWAAAHASPSSPLLPADPASRGFVVGGTSAGGNIAAVLTHLAKDAKLSPPLTGQYLAIPALLPPDVVPPKYQAQYLSFEQNAHAPVLPIEAIQMFMGAYNPDPHSSLYVPFNHPSGHEGLPPAYIQVCGMDPLRDEAIIYEQVLREECGIQTKIDVYPGLPHGFWSFFPMLSQSKKLRVDTVVGMGFLLGMPTKDQPQTTPQIQTQV